MTRKPLSTYAAFGMIFGSLTYAASGGGLFGTLVVGLSVAVLSVAGRLAAQAHKGHENQKTWWTDRPDGW